MSHNFFKLKNAPTLEKFTNEQKHLYFYSRACLSICSRTSSVNSNTAGTGGTLNKVGGSSTLQHFIKC